MPPAHQQTDDDPIRVLHVDDEPDFAELVATFLEREYDHIEVQTAHRAEAGLEVLEETPIDCVLSDYDMPGPNGIEFLEAVREQYPDLPFILFTGKGSEAVAGEAISAGVTDYLQKESGTSQYAVLANRITNVVQQYRSRRAVAETERKLSEIADRTDDVLFMFDADWSEVLFVNAAYETVWGGTIDELTENPETFIEYVHPEDRAAARESMERLAAGEPQQIEYRVEGPDGEYRWIRGESKPISVDGSVSRIVGSVRDITDQKERERELRRKERRYQAVFNDPNILVGLVDTDGTVLDINETAMAYVDTPLDDIVGDPLWEGPWFNASESIQSTVQGWVERAASGEYVEFQADLERPDGTTYTVEGVFRPVMNEDDEVVSLLISDRDVTDRIDRERELKRYEAYLQESSDIVTVLDADGTIEYQSPAVERILGYEPGALEGENGFAYIHEDDVDAVFEQFTELVEQPGATVTAECRFRTADDGWRWLEIRGTNHLETDPIHGVITNNRDITDRKEHERELERERDRFRAVFEEAFDAMVIADDDGEYVAANRSAAELFGVDRDDLLGRSIQEFAPEDFDFDAAWRTFQESDAERGTFPIVRPDGTERLVEYAATPNIVAGQHLSVLRDVTERERREAELERKTEALEELNARLEAQYRTLFEEAPVMAVVTRAEDGRPVIEDCNEQFVEQLGYERAALLERDLASVYTPDSRAELLEKGGYRRSLEGEFTREDRTLETADGDVVETILRAVPRRDETGAVVGTLAMYVDVTEREQIRRANERLEAFTHVVSHDLRNPLSVAAGHLELARETVDDEHLATVASALDRMDALIEDLLTLARQGQDVGALEPVELDALVRECWETVATADATIRADVDRTLLADRSRLRQLLENLARNSVDHGGVDVTVTVGLLEDGFYVADDGPGIPEEKRDAVFEAGYSRDESGTGFGLSIVRDIVEAHGWTIEVTESDDGGARFEVRGVDFADG